MKSISEKSISSAPSDTLEIDSRKITIYNRAKLRIPFAQQYVAFPEDREQSVVAAAQQVLQSSLVYNGYLCFPKQPSNSPSFVIRVNLRRGNVI